MFLNSGNMNQSYINRCCNVFQFWLCCIVQFYQSFTKLRSFLESFLKTLERAYLGLKSPQTSTYNHRFIIPEPSKAACSRAA